MSENEVSGEVIDSAFQIHKKLGPGLYESVYEEILFYELIKKGLIVKRQISIPVVWETVKMEHGFRADLLVEEKVLVEIKSIEAIANVHKKQVITYLCLSNIRLGLLLNFNVGLMKEGITRLVNNL